MGRGRPPGSKNKPKDGAQPHVTEHDNVARTPLSDEQLEALTASWSQHYSKALRTKKDADADLKDVAKKAKSEGVLLADIKAYLKAETEEGQAELRVEAERIIRIARWRSFEVGHQPGLFEDGSDVNEVRSFTLGKEDGLAARPAKVQPGCDVGEYMRGYHVGQATNAAGIKQLKDEDAKAFD